MDEIKLRNFRCFKNEQRAPLAPLTFLLGENSTGKTSFLAIVRALWNIIYGGGAPDFNEDPYNFGTFENIIFCGKTNGDDRTIFEAGLKYKRLMPTESLEHEFSGDTWIEVTFGKKGTNPAPVGIKVSNESNNLMLSYSELDKNRAQITVKTNNGTWRSRSIPVDYPLFGKDRFLSLPRLISYIGDSLVSRTLKRVGFVEFDSVPGFKPIYQIGKKDWGMISSLDEMLYYARGPLPSGERLPYASSPVRSKPRRTYDPRLFSWDSEGNFVPMYLAELFEIEPNMWHEMKRKLDDFGRKAGLFDEISINRSKDLDGGTFRIEIQKIDSAAETFKRNLIDVGYGVSQVLPIAAELLRSDPSPLLLLQQPEVHLHPTAQAALGSFLLSTANRERTIIVETHSNYLLDRVRMDVRDNKFDPSMVSVLYFENRDLETNIHSIRFDEDGNVLGAPGSYGQFFMDEVRRSLRL